MKKKKRPLKYRLRIPILWIGYKQKKCEKILESKYKLIIEQNFRSPNSRRGIKRIDRLIADMEFAYQAYRIRNFKFNSSVDSTEGTASGTLKKFRKYLGDIVLEPNVKGENKKTAINLLMSTQSNETLYEIAKKDIALAEISLEENETIASYIIKNFPKGCDHNLINLAFYWSASNNSDLVKAAINKITSPKSLFTLCLFFRDNKASLEYAKLAIDRIGDMALESKKKLDEAGESCQGKDCKKEHDWLKSHEMSVLYSSHKALEKIIITYADHHSIKLNDTEKDEEEKLVQRAIDKMVVADFLKNVKLTTLNTVKHSMCESRLTEINGEEKVTDETYRDRLMKANCSEALQIEAINNLNFEKEENKKIKTKLAERLETKRNGKTPDPDLAPNVGYAFCEKVNGKHTFVPLNNGATIEHCIYCGITRNPKTIDEIMGMQSVLEHFNKSNKNQPVSEDKKAEE